MGPVPPAPRYTQWIKWPSAQKQLGRMPDIVLDVPLTLRRGCTLHQGPNNIEHGPKTDVRLQLDVAFGRKQLFDEWGRIVELKERRDRIRAEWTRARDRGQDPVPTAERMIAEWCTQDAYRVQAGTLAAGPCVLQGHHNVYREPAPGEQITPDMRAEMERIQRKSTAATAAQLVDQLVRALGGGAPARAPVVASV